MDEFERKLRQAIDQKTKPIGALGRLEAIALQIGMIQQTLTPRLGKPTVLVFAGDHGAAQSGVSSYPQVVTYQMVLNFLEGGAGINVFCERNGMDLKVIDAGVNHDFPDSPGLVDAKIGRSTRNYLFEPAMSEAELLDCFQRAESIVADLAQEGCNIVGFGEMGIGNSASASLIMSVLCGLPVAECTGRGAGGDDKQLSKKIALLQRARALHAGVSDPRQALRTFGGFEIAQMAAAMLAARQRNMIILVDGFISTAAYLAAVGMAPGISANAIFCTLSDEQGHARMLQHLDARPLLKLSLRLGEGAGCALAYPLVRCAVSFLTDMASFDSAGVSGGE